MQRSSLRLARMEGGDEATQTAPTLSKGLKTAPHGTAARLRLTE